MVDGENAATREIIDTLHTLQRDLAVITERLANDRSSRDVFAQMYEVRHKELQAEVFEAQSKIETAERERNKLMEKHAGMDADIKQLQRDVSSINAKINWFVYLILGLVLTAVILGAIGSRAILGK